MKSVKPALKQLQQSIQAITSTQADDGKFSPNMRAITSCNADDRACTVYVAGISFVPRVLPSCQISWEDYIQYHAYGHWCSGQLKRKGPPWTLIISHVILAKMVSVSRDSRIVKNALHMIKRGTINVVEEKFII